MWSIGSFFTQFLFLLLFRHNLRLADYRLASIEIVAALGEHAPRPIEGTPHNLFRQPIVDGGERAEEVVGLAMARLTEPQVLYRLQS